MNAQTGILRMALAGGLMFGLSGCGYVEGLLEDETTTSPGDLGSLSASKAADYGAAATALGLVDGLVEGFGSTVGNVASKGGVVRTAAVSGTDCPVIDITGFNPASYPPSTLPDSAVVEYDYTGSAPGCADENSNPLSGVYTATATGLSDETWPASVDGGSGGFTDLYHWRFDDATLLFDFVNMMADLPAVTTTTNGTLQVAVTTDGTGETTKVATNVGDIRTVFDDGSIALAALFNMASITKVLPPASSVSTTDGDFRLTVALFGYLDVNLDTVVVDEATCPHHPTSGMVSFTGQGGDVLTVDFATGTCTTLFVTPPGGSTTEETAPDIF